MARVLLVEDDPDQLLIRSLILEAAGHRVLQATTRQEAEGCRECDVAVVDLIPEAAELLTELRERARVIVLSGRELDWALFPADRFLKKPCPTAILLATIAELCPKAHGVSG